MKDQDNQYYYQAAVAAQFYSPQQAVTGVPVPSHGHSSTQAGSLARLQQLTQGLEILGQPVPQSHVPHASPPPTLTLSYPEYVDVFIH